MFKNLARGLSAALLTAAAASSTAGFSDANPIGDAGSTLDAS
ncbi:MAG: hypothetical protein ABI605_18985 [Rhizobacter sp.]